MAGDSDAYLQIGNPKFDLGPVEMGQVSGHFLVLVKPMGIIFLWMTDDDAREDCRQVRGVQRMAIKVRNRAVDRCHR